MEISHELADYSVAIGRIRNDDTATFRIVGSGVFVVRQGMHGVLTAHHCLHACSPEINLGNKGPDKLIFVVRMGRTIFADTFELIEHPLAHPKNQDYQEYGPDLTFIEIPQGPRLSTFKSIVAFWNLDRKPGPIRKKYCFDHAYLTAVGFPEARYEIKTSKRKVECIVGHIAFAGALRKEKDITLRRGWDYIRLVCDDKFAIGLPASFAGISGGAIWAVRLRQKKDKPLEVLDFCLVGIAFYEKRSSKLKRFIRGHFVRSIYTRAWVRFEQLG